MKKLLVSFLLLGVVSTSQAFFNPEVEVVDYITQKNIKVSVDVFKVGKPAPTVILGHNCAGARVSYAGNRKWAGILNSWGYNVVIPDSFSPRGYDNICANTYNVSPSTRAVDIKTVAAWVKQQPWHTGKVGYIGFSHGGGTGEILAKQADTGLSAIVEYYPYCQGAGSDSFMPVQIHIGSADTWTPADLCQGYAGKKGYDLNVYEGATHSFEREPSGSYMGHRLQYDRAFADQAQERTKEFFAKNLQP